jgi:hypothetical protein
MASGHLAGECCGPVGPAVGAGAPELQEETLGQGPGPTSPSAARPETLVTTSPPAPGAGPGVSCPRRRHSRQRSQPATRPGAHRGAGTSLLKG